VGIKNKLNNAWISMDILKSSNRMLFCMVKKTKLLINKSLSYIKNYQIIYREVIKEVNRRYLEKEVRVAINKQKSGI
jgi:hypothetical protein